MWKCCLFWAVAFALCAGACDAFPRGKPVPVAFRQLVVRLVTLEHKTYAQAVLAVCSMLSVKSVGRFVHQWRREGLLKTKRRSGGGLGWSSSQRRRVSRYLHDHPDCYVH